MNLQKEAVDFLGYMQQDFNGLNIPYYTPALVKVFRRVYQAGRDERSAEWILALARATASIQGPWDPDLSGKQNAQNVAMAIVKQLETELKE